MRPVKVSPFLSGGPSINPARWEDPFYAGGNGVGVLGPYLPYFPSMYSRISLSDLPSVWRRITSRVMSRQMFQVAA